MASDRAPHVVPQFSSVDDERRHRKQRLAAAFRLFGHFGFDEGAAGHITARDPEWHDHFWVNPLGMNFKQIRVKDLLLVNAEGEVVEGNWPLNAAAFVIHSHIHAARPDVVSAAHAHSAHGKAWSSLRRPLDPLTQDACAFYGDHVVFDDYTGAVLDPEEGKRIAHALGGRKAAILSNHGLLTVGHSVDEAAGGSSRWSAPARRSCSPRRPAPRCSSTLTWPRRRPPRPGATPSAGGSSSPCTTGSSSEQPDLLDE